MFFKFSELVELKNKNKATKSYYYKLRIAQSIELSCSLQFGDTTDIGTELPNWSNRGNFIVRYGQVVKINLV